MAGMVALKVRTGGSKSPVIIKQALSDAGRILVRESGTEPLVRVMVEAPEQELCRKYVGQVVRTIRDKGYEV